ncbi:hypothetical protein E1A91_D12G110800v1 [Gossypium mustelinum]|uniref:40S ribosomal protein S6 n=1 Tax=Gossypium mustelinum TaxID=34275 RepID=A0A5D2SCP4_GOSMU|nr:hypothetical protein E1A91_D12G110800v1 [Gossypium mustelinum]TYI50577.1 hypothetical protein E1A91_D12G110800v1 [Gossypium mustelinum]
MALKRGLSSVGVQRSRSSGSRLPIVILFFFSILTLLVFFVGQGLYISIRRCIVSQDLSVLNLVIVKKGENDLTGLTDTEKPRMRGPKRASKIRKLFNLSKEDDVRKYLITGMLQ